MNLEAIPEKMIIDDIIDHCNWIIYKEEWWDGIIANLTRITCSLPKATTNSKLKLARKNCCLIASCNFYTFYNFPKLYLSP